jgi:hypothetical protein
MCVCVCVCCGQFAAAALENKRAFPDELTLAELEVEPPRGRMRDVVAPEYRTMTLALFVLSFVNCFAYYGLVIVTPGTPRARSCSTLPPALTVRAAHAPPPRVLCDGRRGQRQPRDQLSRSVCDQVRACIRLPAHVCVYVSFSLSLCRWAWRGKLTGEGRRWGAHAVRPSCRAFLWLPP